MCDLKDYEYKIICRVYFYSVGTYLYSSSFNRNLKSLNKKYKGKVMNIRNKLGSLLILLSINAFGTTYELPEESYYRLFADSERYDNKASSFSLFTNPDADHAPPNTLAGT